MGKHLKQKSAPVKAEKKSAARKQPVKSAQDILRYDRAGSIEVQPRRIYPR